MKHLPPTGFHGLLALFLAKRIDPENKNSRVGLVFGSVFPDLDLIGSFFIFILTQDKFLTIYFHRTVTHSLIVMLGLLGIALTFFYYKKLEKRRTISYFLFGFIGGMFLHALLDLFYLDGVTLFWPFQLIGDRTTILSFTFDDLNPAYNDLLVKIIATLDGGFEAIYYFVFAYLASEYDTNQSLRFDYFGKTLIISEWVKKLKRFAWWLIIICVCFLCLAILSINWSTLSRDNFIILLYIPLLPVYVFSGILPLLMRETIEKME